MAEYTSIEWTDHTFNPWIGCTKVSPACDNCYAEALMDTRRHRAKWGPGNPRSRTAASTWDIPKKWQRSAEAFFETHGRRQRVFCASLADVLDNEVPSDWRADLFGLIDETPDLDWLLLSKRIGNLVPMLGAIGRHSLPKNVWSGATVASQAEADRDIPKLLEAKMLLSAPVAFLSIEPMLSPIRLEKWLAAGISWVIVGGESGHNARPIQASWVRSLRDQCASAGVPFLFKQWGEYAPVTEGCNGEPGESMVRVGKKKAGRVLDGRTHEEFPCV